jgi:hypothetical protein
MDSLALVIQGLITIAAVMVGAAGTYFATQRIERSRWEREEIMRWDETKREIYTEYASSVKKSIIRSRSILGGMGLSPTLTPISRELGLPLLDIDENNRSERLEAVMVIGGSEVIAAAREWHGFAWTFHKWANGTESTSSDIVEREYEAAQGAREAFYTAARRELKLHAGDPSQPPLTAAS